MFRAKEGLPHYHTRFMEHSHAKVAEIDITNPHYMTVKEGATGRFVRKRGLI